MVGIMGGSVSIGPSVCDGNGSVGSVTEARLICFVRVIFTRQIMVDQDNLHPILIEIGESVLRQPLPTSMSVDRKGTGH